MNNNINTDTVNTDTAKKKGGVLNGNNKNIALEAEKYELFAKHVEMFRKAFADYLGQFVPIKGKTPEMKSGKETKAEAGINAEAEGNAESSAGEGAKTGIERNGNAEETGMEKPANGSPLYGLLFDELLCNYYQTLISALKKLARYDKKYVQAIIETYEELWLSAPKQKDRDYICPYLFDLCKFLYEMKDAGALAFFYNLLIYCREIPFLRLNGEREKILADAYENDGEEDPFAEFRNERTERLSGSFDEEFFDKTYGKFFSILSGWRKKTKGYYTIDEIYFMSGLFIMDELADYAYFEEVNGAGFSGGTALKSCGTEIGAAECPKSIESEERGEKGEGREADAACARGCESAGLKDFADFKDSETRRSGEDFGECKEIFRKTDKTGGNTYIYVYGDEIKEKISPLYEKALRYFKRAINYEPNNPRYYYEYARCLKNSGKPAEAEIFFKKAFDLNG